MSITVRGEHESTHPPERATVLLTVAVEGPTQDAVFSGASQTAATIGAQIAPLFDRERGPVTWWSSDQVRTWSHRPWSDQKHQLPVVFNSAVSFRVKFNDFQVMSRWLGTVAALANVTIDGIDWALTQASRAQAVELARSAAVQDARDKATSYARNLGLGGVHAVAIADIGMLGDEGWGRGAPVAGRRTMSLAMHSPEGADVGLVFAPQDITISAAVDARFVAEG